MNADLIDPKYINRYFSEYVRRGFRKIFQEQLRIASTKIYAYPPRSHKSRSGALLDALQNPSTSFSTGVGSLSAVARYPTYIRFLDMKRLSNLKIYNRPVWGIIYKETVRDIRYEFHSWLSAYLKRELQNSFQNNK